MSAATTEPPVVDPAADWHDRPADEVLAALGSSKDGLDDAEAARRLERYGPNAIQRGRSVSPLSILLAQFRDVLIYLLLAAAGLSLAVGLLPGRSPNYVDAALIGLILLANGVFGFVQDYRAERSMAVLAELSAPDATVVRSGRTDTVDATEVVPGDVVVIEQGDAVPADARLLSVAALETDEAALTGESASVRKETGRQPPRTPLAERKNMVYMNTAAVAGRGRAVVVATGMDTEVGAIAAEMRAAEDGETPFQREVDALGRRIGAGVLGLIGLLAAVQYLATATAPIAILLTAATLAVAAVPEGLPAVVTVTLARGARKLVRKNALVRRLPVVESLGSVDVIVTDKTGTLTESRMTVRRLLAGGRTYEVTGAGLSASGQFRRDGEAVDPVVLRPLLRCGAVCNDAEVPTSGDERTPRGDPTEVALLVAARKAGVADDPAPPERLREIPFSADRRRMTVVADEDGTALAPDGGPVADWAAPIAYVKGAPEVVLERCDRVLVDGEVRPLAAADRERVLARNDDFAGDALRVLAFAAAPGADPDADPDDVERGLVFLGLQGMLDPPRGEVPDAVADCRRAGVRVVMVTGDNAGTAAAVGEEVGFDSAGALTGAEVADMDDAALREAVESVDVFARVSPGEKVRILRALQAAGHVVAMTGDGVNDAPALRNADVGVAMGVRGTDVAREAADMVLQDDNFATIRDAIAEGRGIFDNIRKFVGYLLSANAGEVLVVFVGVLLASALFPEGFAAEPEALVLTPVMLLWINMVTDGLPALALGADPAAPDVLDRPPRGADERVIDRRMAVSILVIGVLMTVTGLGLFLHSFARTGDLILAQTALFTFLVTVELVRIQLVRRRYDQPLGSNRWLLGAVAVSLALQLAVVYTPLSGFFDVRPLSLVHWGWIGVAFAAFLAGGLAAERLLERLE